LQQTRFGGFFNLRNLKMAQKDKNLPVDMIIVMATVIAGEHVEVGTVIKKVDTELAMELASAGKARPATEELIAEYKKRAAQKAAAQKAAEEKAAAAVAATMSPDAFAAILAKAIASAGKQTAPTQHAA
jgi:pyruvate/2-oxoglutarate dehydrogenase complex dihydrolipoamide acyltransferase (E2) component